MYRTAAERRHMDTTKALRKRRICRKFYGWEYYNNLHQYSKNKIHCSCPICAAKTRMKKRVYGQGKGRYGGRNLTHRDAKIWESMLQQELEY